ncbi:MAG: cobalamin-binding protein [Magnetococcales bacterium]|nr:cobalamin-binding protein [Magnetococcales bacterium]
MWIQKGKRQLQLCPIRAFSARHAPRICLTVIAALTGCCLTAQAAVTVVDDTGRTVALSQPARRIVSLAPDLTELLFAAGAGSALVGVSDFSDYPAEAQQIVRIGGYGRMDIERVVALQPDLVVAWHSGSSQRQLRLLQPLALPVYQAEPRRMTDIAATLRRLGQLAGTAAVAEQTASDFEQQLAQLQPAVTDTASRVPLVYQVWHRPVMTVNGNHLISDVIERCGGRNLFAQLSVMTPAISREAVLVAQPALIVASGYQGEDRPPWLDEWQHWPWPSGPVSLVTIPPEWIQRHNPRILQGAARLCQAIATRTPR